MKNTLRAAGAAGLAAATVIAGIGFGPAAAMAATDAGAETRPLVFEAHGKFWAAGDANINGRLALTPFDSQTEAVQRARAYDIPRNGPGALRLTGTDKCIWDSGQYAAVLDTCGDGSSKLWSLVGTSLKRASSYGLSVDESSSSLAVTTHHSKVDLRIGSDLTVTEARTLQVGATSDWIYVQPSRGDQQGNGYLTVPEGMKIVDHKLLSHRADGPWADFTSIEGAFTLSGDGRSLRAWWAQGSNGDNMHWGPETVGASLALAVKIAVDEKYDARTAPFAFTVQRNLANQRVTYDRTADVPVVPALSARVASFDVAAGTAVLSGIALPDAFVRIDGDLQHQVQANSKGEWSSTLSGLPFSKSTHTVEQFDGADPRGQITVEVDLAVAPVTAKATFQDSIDAPALLNGTAHPDADIDVTDTAGHVVGRTKADHKGDWSFPLAPPNTHGDYPLTITQTVGDRAAGSTQATVQYGDTVAISIPEDGYQLAPGAKLAMTGTGEKRSDGEPAAVVKVHEKGKAQSILATGTLTKAGNWLATIPAGTLEDREYTLVVSQTGRGGNVTTSEVVINRGQSAIAPITGRVTFPGTVTDDAHVVGTAEPGAQITITEGTSTLAQGKADNQGRYDIALASPGTGEHTLTLTETKGTATKSLDVTIDFGAPVTATGPAAAFPGSSTTITGTGADGAQVVLTEGGTVLGKTVVKDGTWSVDVDRVQDGEHTYSVTQTARGATVSTTDVSVTRDAPVSDVTLTTPTSGSTYPAKTSVRFTGTGTPGAAIALKAHFGLAEYTTTVAYDGTWSIDRPMNTGRYVFDLVQTAKGGHTSHVDGIELIEAGTVIDRPFAVTSPESGSTHKDETVAFTGTGTPGSTITIDPKDPSLQKVTTTVAQNGYWTVNRYLGGGAYDFDVTQNAIGGTETGRLANLRINQPATIDRPFAVTTPGDREEHKAEYVTFRGTGTPRSTITAHVTNFASFDSTVTVAPDGTWSFTRWLGTGAYTFEITQTTNGQANGTSTLQLNQPADPVDQPFALTSHEDGDTYTPGSISFTGTGAAGATVTLDPGAGLTKVTTTVQDNGTWKVAKYLGTGPYTFTVTQDDEGTITTLATLHLTATK